MLLERVVKLAGGNPFAAVELARTAGAADDRPGPMGALVLRGLGGDATAALIKVAVLGAAFDTDEYVAISGVSEARAYALLDEALAAGAVERTGAGYRFRHSLVRDALLDGLPPHRLLPLHRRAAEALRDLGASPARIGHQMLQAGDVGAAAPFLLQAARTDAAIGAYRDALALIDTVRNDVRDPERGPLLALRADMLLATGDAGAVVAFRQALGVTRARLSDGGCCPGWPAPVGRRLRERGRGSRGAEPDGSAEDTALLLARGNLAYFIGDLPMAEAAVNEARRRMGVPDPADWRMYELITLQGLLAHLRGEWFGQLGVELRAGAGRPELARSLFDSHLCVGEYVLCKTHTVSRGAGPGRTATASRRCGRACCGPSPSPRRYAAGGLLSGDLTLAEADPEATGLHRLHCGETTACSGLLRCGWPG